MTGVQTAKGDWLFVTPIANLHLTGDIGREFTVKRVTFIHRDKLPRVRKRFRIPRRLSELQHPARNFLKGAETFALLRYQGKPREIRNDCYRIISEEAAILSLSYLGYEKRKWGRAMGLRGQYATGGHNHLFMNTRDPTMSLSFSSPVTLFPMMLDRQWRNFQKFYYFKFLDVLNGKAKVSRSWRKDLSRAAVFAGRSISTVDIPTAFLWNMIALELLLTEQADKVKDSLPKRCEAFMGWAGFWKQRDFKERIGKAYKQRCCLVHEGETDGIDKKLLLFTDDLLLNLLVNIVNHIDIFNSKKKIIEFSKKVQAEHLLGLNSRVRPKRFIALSRRYRHKDFEEM